MVLDKLRFNIKKKFFPNRIKSKELFKYLTEKGIIVGKNTTFYYPGTILIDTQRPWLIKIGENCKITKDVVILSHDFSRDVLQNCYGEVLAEADLTTIGNNVFIGMGAIILMGTKIGDNVIVGAGSVVSGNIPSNCVIAGNPARVIRTLDEHFEKRKNKVKEEAIINVKSFYTRYKRMPNINEMGAFYPLYIKRGDESILEKNNIKTRFMGSNKKEFYDKCLKNNPEYNGFDEFIHSINVK